MTILGTLVFAELSLVYNSGIGFSTWSKLSLSISRIVIFVNV